MIDSIGDCEDAKKGLYHKIKFMLQVKKMLNPRRQGDYTQKFHLQDIIFEIRIFRATFARLKKHFT